MDAFLQYFDVFGELTNHELLHLAISKHGYFSHSKTTPNRDYPHWRNSTVIYADQLREIQSALQREVMARLPEAIESLRMPRFDVDSLELQLTSHNHGEYYKWHTDNGTSHTATRAVTFVYYFHQTPKRYSGGELVIHPANGPSQVVEPRNNSLVMFDSRARHEVRPVVCPSGKFEHGRFTLNGWIRRKGIAMKNGQFGYSMFSPYLPKRSLPALPDSPAAPTESAATGVELRRLREVNARYASLLGLYGRLQKLRPGAPAIDVLPGITRRRFIDNYYIRNLPVVIEGLLAKSKAVRTWSPRFFAERFGDEIVEITTRREGDPLYERHFQGSLSRMSLRELCERMESATESNDFYLVARNFFFDHPSLRSLRAHLRPPPGIINADDGSRGSAKMWLGPKGTVTPLHCDEHSILFTQVYGRKHVKLVPSCELPRMYVEDKYYSAVDPEKPDRARFPDFPFDSVADITLEPGDALFIPVGWWHWVKSLDVSISVTFCSFNVPGRNTELRTGVAARYL